VSTLKVRHFSGKEKAVEDLSEAVGERPPDKQQTFTFTLAKTLLACCILSEMHHFIDHPAQHYEKAFYPILPPIPSFQTTIKEIIAKFLLCNQPNIRLSNRRTPYYTPSKTKIDLRPAKNHPVEKPPIEFLDQSHPMTDIRLLFSKFKTYTAESRLGCFITSVTKA
jgi:hypothetical protein